MSTYRSERLGGEGEEYQRRIALMLLQRATIQNCPFKLAFEMTDAGKFDDVGLFLEQSDEWWLIQAKHTINPKKLSMEMLLPTMGDRTGNFSLFKYLEAFCHIRDYWPHDGRRKRLVLFSNNELDSSVDSEPAIGIDQMFKLGTSGEFVKIKLSDVIFEELEEYINREIVSIFSAITALFKKGEMSDILMSYKTPLMQLFSINDGKVKFAGNILENNNDPRICKLFKRLADDFETLNMDISSISIESSKMKDFWSGNSRNKLLPPSIDRADVERFFEDLVLATSQPNVDQLLLEINHDWRLWMRTWIRPDDLGRLSSSQFEQPFNTFKKSFHEWEKSTTATKEKSFLELVNGQRFLKNVEVDLGDFVRNCSKRSCTNFLDVERFFIHRQIKAVKEGMGTGIDEYALFYNKLEDTDFVDQLYTTFQNQRRFVLVAEPGMGKSILWQYLAFYAQQIYPEAAVFLLYMNNFNHQLPPAETLEDVLNVFETDLSADSLGLFRNESTKILLFLDAFDELSTANLERVLSYICILLHRDNLKILINTRRRVKEMLEKTLNVKAMKLERFDKRTQIEFLRKFWCVTDDYQAKFEQFAGNLLEKFHRDIQRRGHDFTGLPLMLKMLAEIYSKSYKKYAQCDNESLESFESLTAGHLYGNFIKKSIKLTITKKMNVDNCREIPYFEAIAKFCEHDYQLAAISMLLPKELLSEIIDENYESWLKKFIDRIADEETLLVEVVAKTPKFIHLSYAEYFCAGYFYNFLNRSQNLACAEKLADFLDKHDVIRDFFLAMINEHSSENHLNFIRKIGDQAAFWSCQGDYIHLVNFLKQYFNYEKIRQTIPDWTSLYEDDGSTIQCCFLGGCLRRPSMLHLAVEYNALDTLDVLFESRIDVNIRDYKKATPLHYACSNGNLRIVEQLLSRGAKVNAVDGSGYTGLHIAAYEGHFEIVRCLMDHGAKVQCFSRFGETPKKLALKQNHAEIVELLDSKK